MPGTQQLTRNELERLALQPLHQARNWSKADVYLAEWPPDSGQRVVVKDFKKRALWFRLLAGRHFLHREWKILRALSGMEGVPHPIARPDADAIVVEYCPGTPANRFADGTLPATALQRLSTLIEVLHARGVTHGDLHQHNILIADDGSLTLLDWATASQFGPRRRALKARLFDEWCTLDKRAVAKLKARHAPALLTGEERDILWQGGSGLYRAVKKVRHGVGKLRGANRERDRAAALAAYRKILEKDS
ncbi:MAG TPA: RIO1 family regulatory kinase/ATPase [Abditibacteriaceae bacterium]|nr:RIO1 family regulatory kinase/ATPase [Abditibacteriaceae bacterium]